MCVCVLAPCIEYTYAFKMYAYCIYIYTVYIVYLCVSVSVSMREWCKVDVNGWYDHLRCTSNELKMNVKMQQHYRLALAHSYISFFVWVWPGYKIDRERYIYRDRQGGRQRLGAHGASATMMMVGGSGGGVGVALCIITRICTQHTNAHATTDRRT